MNEDEIDFEEDFVSAFADFHGVIADCECGTVHVADQDNSFDWDEGGLERWTEMAKYDPKIIIHENTDYFPIVDIDDTQYVYGCTCEGWRVYYDIIIKHRKELANFSRYNEHTIKKAKEKQRIIDILSAQYTDDNILF